MTQSITEVFADAFKTTFPLKSSPLVDCITNPVTIESMANALLYIDAKPVMADLPEEFPELFTQIDALLLNLGHISPERKDSLLAAGRYAAETHKPAVVDLVGVAATQLRYDIGQQLLQNHPNVVKGNISEVRRFAGLKSTGRGVDGSQLDQSATALAELTKALQELTERFPNTTFLATGETDLVVSAKGQWRLENGVPQLDRFTGTGDIVGALTAALLGIGLSNDEAVVLTVSYFNCCAEVAAAQNTAGGIASFREKTLDQLSLLADQADWVQMVKGEAL
ncbi:hydroxyethylthiazole kinase [Lacticaseibacillus zeae]|uniref:Hydroxyethylthiazole kinase n=1 Tax=Lacticaseibacillus zeae TaxID=57037 RepID=A0A5R8LNY1_LACZE|nr:hydroxyethylthiazole kinase [Lacticaseibacillus zeae]TLF38928.1 hydroxyethylthiazole kinase [Lacticaseibacillus zeae]